MALAIKCRGRLLGVSAALAGAILLAGPAAEAGNRKAFQGLKQEAEAYCKQIKKQKLYECSVEKCPCGDGLRMVRKFDKLRTRGACVCASPPARTEVNRSSAIDYCIEWNYRQGSGTDQCFVAAGGHCPTGARELRRFALVDYGPGGLACRGIPAKPEDKDGSEDGSKRKGKPAKN